MKAADVDMIWQLPFLKREGNTYKGKNCIECHMNFEIIKNITVKEIHYPLTNTSAFKSRGR
jgi:hypothetical protein